MRTPKPTRSFNKKIFSFHSEEGTMIDARKAQAQLKVDGFLTRFVSRGKFSTGCYIYKCKKAKQAL
jgi:hypothetical protein